jgi:hypothetical protein
MEPDSSLLCSSHWTQFWASYISHNFRKSVSGEDINMSLITEQIDRSVWNLVSVSLPYHLRLFILQTVHLPINNNNNIRVVGTSDLGMTTASMNSEYFCNSMLFSKERATYINVILFSTK